MKALIFSLTLLLTLPALASGMKQDRQERWEKIQKEVGITAEQNIQLKKIKEAKRESRQAMRESFKTAKSSFREALKNPSTSKQDLIAKFEAFQTARDQFHKERFVTMLEMREVLTPEQRVKFQHKMMWSKEHGKGHKRSKGQK